VTSDASFTKEAWTTNSIDLSTLELSGGYTQKGKMSVLKGTTNGTYQLWWGYNLQLSFETAPTGNVNLV
jgi:hypothetical protein